MRSNRASGHACKTPAQSSSTTAFSLGSLCSEPNVGKPAAQHRQGSDRRCVGRRCVGVAAARDAKSLLGGFGGCTGRIDDCVGQDCVEGFQARGGRITQVGHLHRGGLASEDAQPIAGCVTGKIDQDVNPIAPDELFHAIV